MDRLFNPNDYFAALLAQDAEAIRAFFHPNAVIRWHVTREIFTVEEFVRVNVDYPGLWKCDIEHELRIGENGEYLFVVAGHIFQDSGRSFHCISYIRVCSGRIVSLDEYWADDGEPPDWRARMNIGHRF